MKIDPNDPRLTAYALGELADSDRIVFEAELAGDPAARQEVEQIRRAAGNLTAKLETEPCPRLEPEQRLVIQERIAPREKETGIGFRWWMGLLAGAATLILVGGLMLPALSRARPKAQTLALNTPTTVILPQTKTEIDSDQFAALRDFNYTGPTLSSRSAGSGIAIKSGGGVSATGGTPPMAIVPVDNAAGGTVATSGGGVTVGDSKGTGGGKDGAAVSVTGAGSIWAGALSVKKEGSDQPENNSYTIANGGQLYNQTSREKFGVGGSNKQLTDTTGFVAGGLGAGSAQSASENSLAFGTTGGDKLTIGGGGSAGNVFTVNSGVVTHGSETVNIGGGALNSSGEQAATIGNGSHFNTMTVWNSGGSYALDQKPPAGTVNGDQFVVGGGAQAATFGNNRAQLDKVDHGIAARGGWGWGERSGPSGSPSRTRQLQALNDEEGSSLGDVPVTGRLFRSQAAATTGPGSESYTPVYDNPFAAVADQPLSTFGLDVDTASYANIRRFLLNNQLPPRDAVRIEEMLNYFSYNYPTPRGSDPFALYVEMGECPWNPAHQLALIGLKAKDVTLRQQPPLNLVFLIDISGSMADAGKLVLIKQAFHLLVPQLTERDRVSIVVYADSSRVVLTSTSGDQHRRIMEAIDSLQASGSTNGGEGIQNAYAQATENFINGGINRVILCTDGDFNVGITDQNELVRLIEQQARSGVFLNVFGFGMGNLKDSTMQKLANKGNGQYAYIDDLDEARKVLVDQARATLITVAKDVKLQIEFNPAHVQAYRLIGYEKRALAARDFNNDWKDAGEMGAGHTVTALYEIYPVPSGVVPAGEPGVDPLKYQPAKNRPAMAAGAEWATVKLRYKEPTADTSKLLTAALKHTQLRWRAASDDFQFAAAVATFGMVLRDSPHKADANLDLALELAAAGRGRDVKGYRAEFIELVKRAGQFAR